MPLLRHLLARFSANPLPIITKRVSPLRKPTHGAKSGLTRGFFRIEIFKSEH